MDMMRTHSGKLRAIGYDAGTRTLRVTLEDGNTLEYANVGESLWRDFKNAGAQWSYYRDNIEDTFSCQRVSPQTATSSSSIPARNPLDDLFK